MPVSMRRFNDFGGWCPICPRPKRESVCVWEGVYHHGGGGGGGGGIDVGEV